MRNSNPAGAILCAVLLLGTAYAVAQPFPSRPVRMVTAAAGAAGDFVSRMIAPGLSESFGQQFVVDNRGGSAVIPIDIVAQSAPDGHSLLVFGSAFWILPLLQKVAYDAVRDFAPVTLAANTPLLLVVHSSLPVKSIAELIARAKAQPGVLNYASGISGSATHLPAELFNSMAGVRITRVTYKGGASALNAILGGEVQVMFATASGAGPLVRANRLRALAVTSAQPSTLFPELPTVAASGLPGYEAASVMCVFAPARTPEAVVQRLNREIVRVLNQPEVKARFAGAGSEVVAGTPAQLAAVMKADINTMGRLINRLGIRGQ